MKKTNLASLILGIFIGISILNPLAQAAENWLRATPSAQKFFVNGKQVELEAYAIEGYNYVRLRDIGKVADFSVSYDPMANAAIVITGQPYSEDAAVPAVSESTDYASQANQAIFAGKYTKEMYNAMRYALLHPEEIAAGTYQPISMGQTDVSAVFTLIGKLSTGETYYSVTETWGSKDKFLSAEHRTEYDAAIAHVRPFLDSIAALPRQEQVRQMVWYIADRMTYNETLKALPCDILAQDKIMVGAGNCATYSSCLYFLCRQAGIPCILVDSENHQWNMVYVDDQWWHVDPTGPNDNVYTLEFNNIKDGKPYHVIKTPAEFRADLEQRRATATVFYEVIGQVPMADGSVQISSTYVDAHPLATEFFKELMVPGSTK